MIIGIGSDLTNITRIQRTLDRFGDRFRDRVFTVIEKEKAARKKNPSETNLHNLKTLCHAET